MSISDEKSHLRREIRTRRAQTNETERSLAAHALSQRLWPFLQQSNTRSIGVYLATPVEISLDPLIQLLLDEGIKVCAPRINLESNTMAFCHLSSLTDVRIGPYNLREPLSDEDITPSLILVPGLAFDTRGHRLGMGAGWYDRTLTPEITTVGICYDWQIIPTIPVEAHDHPMNWIFSDARQWGPF